MSFFRSFGRRGTSEPDQFFGLHDLPVSRSLLVFFYVLLLAIDTTVDTMASIISSFHGPLLTAGLALGVCLAWWFLLFRPFYRVVGTTRGFAFDIVCVCALHPLVAGSNNKEACSHTKRVGFANEWGGSLVRLRVVRKSKGSKPSSS